MVRLTHRAQAAQEASPASPGARAGHAGRTQALASAGHALEVGHAAALLSRKRPKRHFVLYFKSDAMMPNI